MSAAIDLPPPIADARRARDEALAARDAAQAGYREAIVASTAAWQQFCAAYARGAGGDAAAMDAADTSMAAARQLCDVTCTAYFAAWTVYSTAAAELVQLERWARAAQVWLP